QNALARLAQDKSVAWVSPDRKLGAQWDCDTQAIGTDQVWSAPGYKGSGIRVAILDTGAVAGNPDWYRYGNTNSSNYRLVAFKDFVNGQTNAYDDNGHGTHVAGIALGSGNKSQGT